MVSRADTDELSIAWDAEHSLVHSLVGLLNSSQSNTLAEAGACSRQIVNIGSRTWEWLEGGK